MTGKPARAVFIVDDDAGIRQSVGMLLKSVGIDTVAFDSPSSFLNAGLEDAGCILLDVRMPEMSGIEVQRRLSEEGSGIPLIFMTGHGDVGMAVRAMRQGAFDFLEKPIEDQVLIDSVLEALAVDDERRRTLAQKRSALDLVSRLTRREREIAGLLANGGSTRGIAEQLALSVRTVEGYRSRIMMKLEITSLAQLVRILEA
ncbi:MAG: response regulator transcription factor [Betaproteobacteria bacterium]|nr:response regulator transcription factor [Betaproteobacteria bacterium]